MTDEIIAVPRAEWERIQAELQRLSDVVRGKEAPESLAARFARYREKARALARQRREE